MRLSSVLLCLVSVSAILNAQFERTMPLVLRSDSSFLFSPTAPTDTLHIERYLSLVQHQHPEIRIAAAARDRASGAELSAWGLLDPRLTLQAATKSYDGGLKNNELQASLSIPLYWGQRMSLGFRRATAFFDRDYLTSNEGEPSISMSIPLVRNVLTDPVRTAIARTEQGVIAADAAVQERRNLVSLSALSDYYAWAASRARYAIALQLYRIAFTRYQWVSAEILRGERAPIDSVEILQEVFRRRSLLVRTRNAVERSALAVALNIWSESFTSSTMIAQYAPQPLPPPASLDSLRLAFDRERARQRRPELRKLYAEYEQAQFDIRLARESFKPALNAKLSMYSPSWNPQITQLPTFWKAGLDFELPILYRAPAGQEQQAIAQRTQLAALIELQRRRIDNDVLLAAATVNATYEQVLFAQAERIAAEKMVAAEQQLFERGESDLLRLNLRERLLGEAQEREIEALQSHATAWALYRWAIADY